MKRTVILLVFLIVVAIIIIIIQAVFPRTAPSVNIPEGVACTMDAKLCPNGSYVGRIPPTCEFALCPVTGTSTLSTTTFEASIGGRGEVLGVSVSPLEVLFDSRCAANVECIWAGTVTLRASVMSTASTTEQTFTMNESVIVDGKTVTLIEVKPSPMNSGVKIPVRDYKFVFEVKVI